MKNTFTAIVVCLLFSISLKSSAQNKGYREYKTLAQTFIHSITTNDTGELRGKLVDLGILRKGMIESAKGKQDSVYLDSVFNQKYQKIFKKVYYNPYRKLQNQLKEQSITSMAVDSMHLAIQGVQVKDMAPYTLSVYFKSNGKRFSFDLDITKYKDKWYLLEIENALTGPYGYSQTFVGNKLTEEHKIGGDSVKTIRK